MSIGQIAKFLVFAFPQKNQSYERCDSNQGIPGGEHWSIYSFGLVSWWVLFNNNGLRCKNNLNPLLHNVMH